MQVGEYTALPHGSITPQTIREGTIIMIDDGCTVEGYQSDITRTFVLGKATDKMKKVFDIVKQAQTAALKAARPGVPLESIDAAARKVVVDAGYGPGFKYFSHRLGHGMGMDGHEWPYLVKNNMFGWEKALTRAAGHGVQRRAGHLHPRRVRRAARRRHAHHRRTARSCSRRSRSRWRIRSELVNCELQSLIRCFTNSPLLLMQVTSDQIFGTFTFSIDTGCSPPGRGTPGRSRSDLKPMCIVNGEISRSTRDRIGFGLRK